MNPTGDSAIPPRLKRRWLPTGFMVCLGLAAFVWFFRWDHRHHYDGQPIAHWEKQVLDLLPRGGREAEVDNIIRKLGPEATPFWLARMQHRDSRLAQIYLRVWSALSVRVELALPEPIPQRMRRNKAHYVLSKMNFTNGIPELIKLSNSNDRELQEYAVHLLWFRAYQFCRPSEECIAAFCHALKSTNVRARHWAVLGLGILPLHEEALPALEKVLGDPDQSVRRKAEEIIREIKKHNPAKLKHT